jgi:IS5 family transposase
MMSMRHLATCRLSTQLVATTEIEEDPLAQLRAHNAAVRRVRCRIEKAFGTWKRSYGLRRMRWLGLAKAGLQVRLAAMAYNLRRTLTLLQAAAA